jgi:hypothetical protein
MPGYARALPSLPPRVVTLDPPQILQNPPCDKSFIQPYSRHSHIQPDLLGVEWSPPAPPPFSMPFGLPSFFRSNRPIPFDYPPLLLFMNPTRICTHKQQARSSRNPNLAPLSTYPTSHPTAVHLRLLFGIRRNNPLAPSLLLPARLSLPLPASQTPLQLSSAALANPRFTRTTLKVRLVPGWGSA